MAKTTTKSESTASGYRIGSVSRLTGISPDTLRIWERRYAAVVPQRSTAGGRLYDDEDIARLKLMKQLVDAGDAIGVVATLSQDELRARAAANRSAAAMAIPAGTSCRIVVIGEPLAASMEKSKDRMPDIELVARYRNPEAFMAETEAIKADVLVIEQPTLQAETALRVLDWIAHIHAAHAIVVYRFAAQDTLQQLPRAKCSTLRAPVEPQTLRDQCVSMLYPRPTPESDETEPALAPGEPVPPRRYDDETLTKLASISPTIKCECPRHLAELITSLSAFEQYSGECESRSVKDAELHAYLNETASHARHLIENALDRVIEAENIEL